MLLCRHEEAIIAYSIKNHQAVNRDGILAGIERYRKLNTYVTEKITETNKLYFIPQRI